MGIGSTPNPLVVQESTVFLKLLGETFLFDALGTFYWFSYDTLIYYLGMQSETR